MERLLHFLRVQDQTLVHLGMMGLRHTKAAPFSAQVRLKIAAVLSSQEAVRSLGCRAGGRTCRFRRTRGSLYAHSRRQTAWRKDLLDLSCFRDIKGKGESNLRVLEGSDRSPGLMG